MHGFAQEILRPQAGRLDHDPAALGATWQLFVEAGLHRMSHLSLWDALGPLAEESGAFAFVALQQAAAGSPDPPAGVAFGHLRNTSGPAPVWRDGFISGPVPWLTGAGIFERVLLGFRLGDGSEARAWVRPYNRARFRHSLPLPLLAMRGMNTVSVLMQNFPLAEADFLSVDPPGTLAASDAMSVLYHTPLMMGACRASVRLIEASGRGDADKARRVVATLETRIHAALDGGTVAEHGPGLRAQAGDLSVRLARLACMACGSASLVSGHAAERLYRETLVYSLMAQTDLIVSDAFGVLP